MGTHPGGEAVFWPKDVNANIESGLAQLDEYSSGRNYNIFGHCGRHGRTAQRPMANLAATWRGTGGD